MYMTKTCFKCKIEKSLLEFSKNRGRKDGLSGQCKACHTVMRKTHYELNKKKIIGQVMENKKKCYKWFISLKEKPCSDCGVSYPHYVMDFDHLGEKEFSLSNARQGAMSKSRILKEISKCQLVCANCHRVRTHNRYTRE